MRNYQINAQVFGNQTPKVHIRKNSKGELTICLAGWNSDESEDGWSVDEVEELILTLKTALEKSKEINMLEDTNFLFTPKEDVMIPDKQQPTSNHSNEWVAKLIELSSDSVYCYEKYLLEETDWKQLALKMKALQKHIIKYMGGTKDKKMFE